jgi:LemA protein
MRPLLLAVVLIGTGLLLFMGGCNSYNSLVEFDENVANEWSKVESEYQRRADLIPNLVNTVKGVAEFEKSTLTEVVNARAKATSINIDPSNLSEAQLQKFQEAQSGLSQSLGRLLLVSENYPQLRANENFRDLQAQLEGTENRIKVARNRYNDKVTEYNKKVRRFPNSVFASMFGFERHAQFEAEAGTEQAPTVEF